ncbi:MAG: hypothetical protein V7731_04230 [Amphritea sp.]
MISNNDCTPEACQTRGFLCRVLSVCFSIFIAFMLVGAPQVQADPTSPPHWTSQEEVEGNAECVGGEEFFKIDTGGLGTGIHGPFTDSTGGLVVTIEIHSDKSFDWSVSGGTVAQVGVKGGKNTFRYTYVPPATHDHGLFAPNTNSGSRAGLSHISFCYFPGAPILEATKSCANAPVLINEGTQLKYTYTHNIDNASTDGSDFFDLEIKETIASIPSDATVSCNIVSVDGFNVAGAVTLGAWSSVPDVATTTPLVDGDDVDVIIECITDKILGLNGKDTIETRASTVDEDPPDVFAQPSMASCPGAPDPKVAITKTCADPIVQLREVTLDDFTTALAVEVCVNIKVENTGLEALTNVFVVDSLVFGAGDWDVNDANSGPLLAGASIDDDFCYLPPAPTGNVEPESLPSPATSPYLVYTFDDGINQTLDDLALFTNEAFIVTADGLVTGKDATSNNLSVVDDAAHCSICYSDRTNPGLPAACPPPDANPAIFPLQ